MSHLKRMSSQNIVIDSSSWFFFLAIVKRDGNGWKVDERDMVELIETKMCTFCFFFNSHIQTLWCIYELLFKILNRFTEINHSYIKKNHHNHCIRFCIENHCIWFCIQNHCIWWLLFSGQERTKKGKRGRQTFSRLQKLVHDHVLLFLPSFFLSSISFFFLDCSFLSLTYGFWGHEIYNMIIIYVW